MTDEFTKSDACEAAPDDYRRRAADPIKVGDVVQVRGGLFEHEVVREVKCLDGDEAWLRVTTKASGVVRHPTFELSDLEKAPAVFEVGKTYRSLAGGVLYTVESKRGKRVIGWDPETYCWFSDDDCRHLYEEVEA